MSFPRLTPPVLKFFDESKVMNVDERKRRMTIRHLLTMTAGLEWHENLPYNDPKNSSSVMEAAADWVEYALDQPMAEEPGSRFNYSSGATELLAHIFRVATGQDIEEYAAKNLFAPLGIDRFYWKRIPWGLADTEGGLYLERHDLAKLMLLFVSFRQRCFGAAIYRQSCVMPVEPASNNMSSKETLCLRGSTRHDSDQLG